MDELNPASEEARILSQGQQALQELLGTEWRVEQRADDADHGDAGWDALLEVRSPGNGIFTELLVDVRTRVTPKDVVGHLSSTAMLLRRLNRNTHLMIFAPWISPRTQEELRRRGIDYLDLTGNISLRVSQPAIVIHTHGADRAPASHRAPSNKPLLMGARAGRLVRLLADVTPPYRATDLARHAGLSVSYVSRLLDALEDQLLIARQGKAVDDVNWAELLRTRASHLDLMRLDPVGYLAPNGIQAVVQRLSDRADQMHRNNVLVTGSHAARSVAPIAVGGQLMLYALPLEEHRQHLAKALGLLPVSEGADVLMLQPADSSVLHRPRIEGFWQVGLSQLVLDCLSGPGRTPAEGEKVLEYMGRNEDTWRIPSLDALAGLEARRPPQNSPDDTALF
ncbi:helix-turn-helix domain-containing protein [Streptomyces sp. NBC_00147]|uniref:helix-turn-helix domain-containing protein n=1 Tax=Streptomyces sp. NBC_00147 TaxID=2975667 RepID=UPI002F914B50